MSKSKTQLKKMSKEQLEAYGRTIGIELDRRLVKKTLIEQLIEHQASDNVEHTHDNGVTHTHPAGDVEHSHATDEKETVKIKKVLDKVVEKVAAVATKAVGKTKGHVLLRDKSTGAWTSGPKPKGSQTGTSRGEPFWEI